jgi:hypothetical protein
MKLERNGKSSLGNKTRDFNIKYFNVTDLIKRKEMETEYCQTDAMIADFMTKPLVGGKFLHFRDEFCKRNPSNFAQQECVGIMTTEDT